MIDCDKQCIILGAGGHAKVVADTIIRQGIYKLVGFIDNKATNKRIIDEYYVIGDDSFLPQLFTDGVSNIAIGIGFIKPNSFRKQLFIKLSGIGFNLPPIIDDSATVSKYVSVKRGVYIGKKCVVNPNVLIKEGAIINSASIIEHDSVINEYSHVSVSAVICGGCNIGSNTFIGANATVIQGINIAPNCLIGAGAIITKDIELPGSIVVGNNRLVGLRDE